MLRFSIAALIAATACFSGSAVLVSSQLAAQQAPSPPEAPLPPPRGCQRKPPVVS